MSASLPTQHPPQGPPTLPRAWVGGKGGTPSRLATGGRRKRIPYLVVGALLVVVCAAGAVVSVLQVGDRQSVLALARPVSVGHVLSAQDLREVSVSVDKNVDVVLVNEASSVLGQPLAYSLPTGTLLSRQALGSAQVPSAGQAMVAVPVKPGQFPPALGSGATVSVIVASSASGVGQAATGGPWPATVIGVDVSTNDQTSVVSLQLPISSAVEVAAIPAGQLALVALPSGGR